MTESKSDKMVNGLFNSAFLVFQLLKCFYSTSQYWALRARGLLYKVPTCSSGTHTHTNSAAARRDLRFSFLSKCPKDTLPCRMADQTTNLLSYSCPQNKFLTESFMQKSFNRKVLKNLNKSNLVVRGLTFLQETNERPCESNLH